jgi:cation transport ATPase
MFGIHIVQHKVKISSHPNFSISLAVTFLFAISEALESKCTARARNALAAIISLRPERANLINPITKDVVVLPATSVAVGTIVSVRPGDKIPCDGIIMEGKQCHACFSILTTFHFISLWRSYYLRRVISR